MEVSHANDVSAGCWLHNTYASSLRSAYSGVEVSQEINNANAGLREFSNNHELLPRVAGLESCFFTEYAPAYAIFHGDTKGRFVSGHLWNHM